MYKIVTEDNQNEVWATGYSSKEKAQDRINSVHYRQFMYDIERCKKFIVIECKSKNK